MAEALQISDSDFSDEEINPLDVSFNKAADRVRKISGLLNDKILLELYGFFKQGTEGDCNISKPSWFDGKGRKKWDSWNTLKDMSQEEAKQKYIDLVVKYDPAWTSSENVNNPTTQSKETWVTVSSLRYSPEPELSQHSLSLIEAARENCAQQVTELLSNNPNLKYEKDQDGLSALHWAADRNATEALVAAINGGCPINALDNCGQTALHYASSCDHLKSTQILLNAGSEIIKDNEGCTPLDLTNDNEIRKILQNAIK